MTSLRFANNDRRQQTRNWWFIGPAHRGAGHDQPRDRSAPSLTSIIPVSLGTHVHHHLRVDQSRLSLRISTSLCAVLGSCDAAKRMVLQSFRRLMPLLGV